MPLNIEILNIDALDWIHKTSDNAADLIILDPDYQDWDSFIEAGIINEAIRTLKPEGNILAFTKQPFDFNLRNAVQPWMRREIVWTFENGGAWVSKKMPLVSHQKIYWLTKTKGFYFNPRTGLDYSDSTKNFKRSEKVFGGWKEDGRSFTRHPDGIWIRDHLHFNKPNTGAIPAKPAKLIEIMLRCFCPREGFILDLFAGSGIVEVEAIKQNKSVCACEINPERYRAIMDKIEY